MMLFRYLDCDCQDDNDFSEIKNQIEKKISIEEERNIVYRYEKECIISLNNNWFAILDIEDELLYDVFSTLKVLHKIFEEKICIEDFKKQNKINIVNSNNKGILYCNCSQINKMKNIRA